MHLGIFLGITVQGSGEGGGSSPAPIPPLQVLPGGLARPQKADAADGWVARIARNGGTFNATTLAAIRALDYDLSLFDLKRKLIYLNMRCGDDIIAARTPLIARRGPGLDVVASGSFAAWDEANGLANGTNGVMDTGVVVLPTKGVSHQNFSLGMYLLNDVATSTAYSFGSTGSTGTPVGNIGLNPRNNTLTVLDFPGVRNQTDASVSGDGSHANTKGLICGSLWGAGLGSGLPGGVFRNGVLRGNFPFAQATTGYLAFASIKIVAVLATSGGDYIGYGLTPDDVSNLFWIMHEFNASLSTPRQVTADGVS